MQINKYNNFNRLILVYLCYIQYTKLVRLCDLHGRSKRKRVWTREIFTDNEREMYGFFSKLFLKIKEQDPEQFRKATRMGITQFEILHNLLKKKLTKKNFIRTPIDPEFRLVLTLVYLAHGPAWQILSWSFRIGVSTVREIILEVCQIIWDELSSIYLSPPTEGEYERIIGDFYNNTGMPNVAGAIDGKHIRIKCPPHSGSQYFNYKKYHSIVLLAACDSNYVFSAVDVGAYGSQSDGGILKQSGFGNQILQGNINIPKTRKLPGTNVEFPCFFIGDAAFPLRHNIMRPYPGRLLPKDKELFNKKLSSARVKIENAFGILTAKFRILRNSLNMLPENAEKVVRATLVIHNFIRLNDSSNYFSSSFVDHINEDSEMVPGNWRNEVDPLPQCRMFTRFNASREAFSIRDTLKEYLNNVNI